MKKRKAEYLEKWEGKGREYRAVEVKCKNQIDKKIIKDLETFKPK